MLSFAHLLTGDRYDAEDVVQTALAATALGWHRERSRDNPEGYVRRAIVTTHLNRQRRRPWRERPSADLPHPPHPRAGGSDLDERGEMWRGGGPPPRPPPARAGGGRLPEAVPGGARRPARPPPGAAH